MKKQGLEKVEGRFERAGALMEVAKEEARSALI